MKIKHTKKGLKMAEGTKSFIRRKEYQIAHHQGMVGWLTEEIKKLEATNGKRDYNDIKLCSYKSERLLRNSRIEESKRQINEKINEINRKA